VEVRAAPAGAPRRWSAEAGAGGDLAGLPTASPRDDLDPPSDEELLAFLDVIDDARRADA
jgi:hypothetical protein